MASSREKILDYLSAHGGSVSSVTGRGLTSDMAHGLGYRSPATLSAMLSRLEEEGLILREVRGRRTYRIALATSSKPRAKKRRHKPSQQLERALCHRSELRGTVLVLLANKSDHGYQLVERLKPLGYEDDPAHTYRTLRWLAEAGLVHATWDIGETGPARRVYAVTPEGRHMAQRYVAFLAERSTFLENELAPGEGREAVGTGPTSTFEVLAEVKLRVAAPDPVTARRSVERAFSASAVSGNDKAMAQVWVYDPVEVEES